MRKLASVKNHAALSRADFQRVSDITIRGTKLADGDVEMPDPLVAFADALPPNQGDRTLFVRYRSGCDFTLNVTGNVVGRDDG